MRNYSIIMRRLGGVFLFLLSLTTVVSLAINSIKNFSVITWAFFFVLLPVIFTIAIAQQDSPEVERIDWRVEFCLLTFFNFDVYVLSHKLKSRLEGISLTESILIVIVIGFFVRSCFRLKRNC